MQHPGLSYGVMGALHVGQNLGKLWVAAGSHCPNDASLPVLSLQSVVYCHGGRVGFFQGDIRLLSDDMKALCPTIFPVVPRLLNRMYDKVSPEGSLGPGWGGCISACMARVWSSVPTPTGPGSCSSPVFPDSPFLLLFSYYSPKSWLGRYFLGTALPTMCPELGNINL